MIIVLFFKLGEYFERTQILNAQVNSAFKFIFTSCILRLYNIKICFNFHQNLVIGQRQFFRNIFKFYFLKFSYLNISYTIHTLLVNNYYNTIIVVMYYYNNIIVVYNTFLSAVTYHVWPEYDYKQIIRYQQILTLYLIFISHRIKNPR